MWLQFLPAKQCVVAWSPPWRGEDVIFFVMHIPALPIGKRWACKELGWLRAQRHALHSHGCLWMLRMPHKRPLCQLQLPLSGVVNSTKCIRRVFFFYIPSIPPCPIMRILTSTDPKMFYISVQPNQRLCYNILWHLRFGSWYQSSNK